VGVLSADVGAARAGVVHALQPRLAEVVCTADQTRWEGETVLVLGPSDVVGRARRHATGS
jgi:hypothetical protein